MFTDLQKYLFFFLLYVLLTYISYFFKNYLIKYDMNIIINITINE